LHCKVKLGAGHAASIERHLLPPAASDHNAVMRTPPSFPLAAVLAITAFVGAGEASVKPSVDPRQRARENLVHVLLNHNDFLTIR